MVSAAPFRFNARKKTWEGADTTFINTLALAGLYDTVLAGVKLTDNCCALPNPKTVPDGGV